MPEPTPRLKVIQSFELPTADSSATGTVTTADNDAPLVLASTLPSASPSSVPQVDPMANQMNLISALPNPNLQCEKFMQYPAGYRVVRVFTDTGVAQSTDNLLHHPHLLHLLGCEVVLLIAYLALRMWRLNHAVSWGQRAWTKTWTLVAYYSSAVFFVPILVLWDDYSNLLRALFNIMRGH
ncbi:hypothetical protein WDW86_16660 [Bdellovibrionota bacterium FG-2]